MLVLTDIYAAREQPLPGVTGVGVSEAARRHGHRDVHYIADKRALPTFLAGHVQPGDLVLTMGAGDIHRAGKALLRVLQNGDAPTGAEAPR